MKQIDDLIVFLAKCDVHKRIRYFRSLVEGDATLESLVMLSVAGGQADMVAGKIALVNGLNSQVESLLHDDSDESSGVVDEYAALAFSERLARVEEYKAKTDDLRLQAIIKKDNALVAATFLISRYYTEQVLAENQKPNGLTDKQVHSVLLAMMPDQDGKVKVKYSSVAAGEYKRVLRILLNSDIEPQQERYLALAIAKHFQYEVECVLPVRHRLDVLRAIRYQVRCEVDGFKKTTLNSAPPESLTELKKKLHDVSTLRDKLLDSRDFQSTIGADIASLFNEVEQYVTEAKGKLFKKGTTGKALNAFAGLIAMAKEKEVPVVDAAQVEVAAPSPRLKQV
jgi:hypothetical protein